MAISGRRLPAYRDGACPSSACAAMNDVGKPCAGEPHARFEVAGAGDGATTVGHQRVPGRCAEKRHRYGLVGTQPTACRYRASARPYLRERPRPVQAVGAVCAMVGAILIAI